VRHREREARRWLDELGARMTNLAFWERRPEDYVSLKDKFRIHTAMWKKLERADPELCASARWLTWYESTSELDLTYKQWGDRACRRVERWRTIRKGMQRAGLI